MTTNTTGALLRQLARFEVAPGFVSEPFEPRVEGRTTLPLLEQVVVRDPEQPFTTSMEMLGYRHGCIL